MSMSRPRPHPHPHPHPHPQPQPCPRPRPRPRPRHARVCAHWIIAHPFLLDAHARWIPTHARPCLLDPRTPVPAGSPHAHAHWIPTPARVRARWIPMHARTHPPGPCMPAGCARTALTTLARTVLTPARSWGPHALMRCPHARARRIPECYVVMGEGYCSSSSSSSCCRTVL